MPQATDFLAGHDLAVYSTAWCPDCRRLKRWLDASGVEYREIDIDNTPGAAEKLEAETGKLAVPFILVDDRRWVRGYHNESSSRLDEKLLIQELQDAIRTER
jgi:mycoredoxin